jgi:type IV pilus assembly protein PilY1
VPGNLALVLSVEYPTAISVANLGNYADASTYYWVLRSG